MEQRNTTQGQFVAPGPAAGRLGGAERVARWILIRSGKSVGEAGAAAAQGAPPPLTFHGSAQLTRAGASCPGTRLALRGGPPARCPSRRRRPARRREVADKKIDRSSTSAGGRSQPVPGGPPRHRSLSEGSARARIPRRPHCQRCSGLRFAILKREQ